MRLENKLNKSSVMVTAGANQVGKIILFFFFLKILLNAIAQKKKKSVFSFWNVTELSWKANCLLYMFDCTAAGIREGGPLGAIQCLVVHKCNPSIGSLF